MIKGGAREGTVFHSVNVMMAKGMTVQQAIVEVEKILRCQLPEDIKARISQECG